MFHAGTPNAALLLPAIVAAAARHGLATVAFSRPGYAGSSEHPGRAVVDNATITAAALDELGVELFYTAGWSGGGPHALADVAKLADRCIAAATIAGVAPYTQEFDWLAGMAEENVEEFGLALKGEYALVPLLEAYASGLSGVSAADVAESLGGLVSDVDKAALTGEFAEIMAASLRGAVARGIAGWRDDDLAFVKPWGFELGDLTRPVAVWQGEQDRMVPSTHGDWLAAHVPTAVPRLRPAEGHLSLIAAIDEIVDDLVALG